MSTLNLACCYRDDEVTDDNVIMTYFVFMILIYSNLFIVMGLVPITIICDY